MASSLFNPPALQSFSTISLQVFFGLPLGLEPSTSYSIHFFTQLLSSFCSTCPYHRNLFWCITVATIMILSIYRFPLLVYKRLKWRIHADQFFWLIYLSWSNNMWWICIAQLINQSNRTFARPILYCRTSAKGVLLMTPLSWPTLILSIGIKMHNNGLSGEGEI